MSCLFGIKILSLPSDMIFHALHSDILDPERFTFPFCYEPHPLCVEAARAVCSYIAGDEETRCDADRGKMFGVLIVRDKDNIRPCGTAAHKYTQRERKQSGYCYGQGL